MCINTSRKAVPMSWLLGLLRSIPDHHGQNLTSLSFDQAQHNYTPDPVSQCWYDGRTFFFTPWLRSRNVEIGGAGHGSAHPTKVKLSFDHCCVLGTDMQAMTARTIDADGSALPGNSSISANVWLEDTVKICAYFNHILISYFNRNWLEMN